MTLLDFIAIANGLLILVLTLMGFVLTLKPPMQEHRKRWAIGIAVIAAVWLGVFVWQQAATRAAQKESDLASEDNRRDARAGQEKSDNLVEELREQVAELIKTSTKPPLAIQVPVPSSSGVKSRPTASSPPALPPSVVSEIRFTERRTDSPKKEFPYALQVIIQTTVTIQPTAFKIEFDGEIAEGTFFLSGQPTIMLNMQTGWNKNTFFFSFGFPAFTPESSIVATLLSKSPVRAKRVERVRA